MPRKPRAGEVWGLKGFVYLMAFDLKTEKVLPVAVTTVAGPDQSTEIPFRNSLAHKALDAGEGTLLAPSLRAYFDGLADADAVQAEADALYAEAGGLRPVPKVHPLYRPVLALADALSHQAVVLRDTAQARTTLKQRRTAVAAQEEL